MSAVRQGFSSRIGFIFAAAGSAVGVGNIWGFPTQAAQNGGGAFLLVYLIMVVILAYPMLVAELTIGRLTKRNPVASLRALGDTAQWQKIGSLVGVLGILALSLILSFYAIISGWLVSFMAAPFFSLLGFERAASWLTEFSTSRNLIMMLIFLLLTIKVVGSGVTEGIERWSRRLMPLLFLLLLLMTAYILTLPGAMVGLEMYLVPDFSQVMNPDLIVSAMGQAFFSLSIGVCALMVYGSYLNSEENLPKTAAIVAGLDTSVAFLAGLLILPAMFVAQNNGVEIYTAEGSLKSSDTLVFTVLPSMFDGMGVAGSVLAIGFFALMVIAALTSAISMLEAPVNTLTEETTLPRNRAVWVVGGAVATVSAVIVFNFNSLFGLVVTLTTVYAQPLLALVFGLMLTWVLRRDRLLKEMQEGNPELMEGVFWKIWPWYVKFVCPLMMLLVFFY
ncbi:sodium-dependent transporter [Vibrio sp. 404]|uniref:Sodium-dependent transporter n=2 Tax=Vibrio marinisediminis TaxID=2758441 RepID=A0A7W2IV58_9VIBR|nr:sodium-dependent transporter [Vibrio marinisediminis]MBA5764094.1 sodium-dependent transporter [Vibrio marinisediminis]